MERSRILVVYYSRTGTTRAVAEAIRAELRCEIERICDRTERSGVTGYLRSFFDALFERPAPILRMRSQLSEYDLVIVGGPVWNGGIAAPVRTFLDRHHAELKRVGFFCTCRHNGSGQALREMTEHAGQCACVTLDVRSEAVNGPSLELKIRTFCTVATAEAPQRNPCASPQVLQHLLSVEGA
jgi:flavodoxin